MIGPDRVREQYRGAEDEWPPIRLRGILEDIGADPERGVYTHHLYGNTASASVGVTYQRLLEEREVKAGDKIVLGSAAAGFSVVIATGEWTQDKSRL